MSLRSKLVKHYLVIIIAFLFVASIISYTFALPYYNENKIKISTPSISDAQLIINSNLGFFIENNGQWDDDILYVGNTSFGRIVLHTNQIQYQLIEKLEKEDCAQGYDTHNTLLDKINQIPSYQYQSHVVTLKYPNAQPVSIQGNSPTGTLYNYFIGNNPDKWGKACKAYREIIYSNIWEGIDLKYYFSSEGLKYDFILSPDADEKQLLVLVEGSRLDFSPHELAFHTSLSTLKDTSLYAYGETTKKPYTLSFAQNTKQCFTFEGIPPSPRKETIVIDPIIQSSYLGGSDVDFVNDLLILDKTYIAGRTDSPDLPSTDGGAQENYSFTTDGFVASLSLDLTQIYQVTYIGGNGNDLINSMMPNIRGDLFIAGNTESTDFPKTENGAQSSIAGYDDGFIATISIDLNSIGQATYLGGSLGDNVSSMAVGLKSGQGLLLYVAGTTRSNDFPNTSGGAQSSHSSNDGSLDGFVTRICPTLHMIHQSTYIGGSDYEVIYGISPSNQSGTTKMYITGRTRSNDFPGTNGGFQESNNGADDGFIAMFNHELTVLEKATYIGGANNDSSNAILITSHNVFVTGETYSTDFPQTAGGAQSAPSSTTSGFISRLSLDLTTLTQSTYLGGSGGDVLYKISISQNGKIFVAGVTYSTDFPQTAGGAQDFYAGEGDIVIARLSPDLVSLEQASYLGGNGFERVNGLSIVQAQGQCYVYVAGGTTSADFPMMPGGGQETYDGNMSSFVSYLNCNLEYEDSESIEPDPNPELIEYCVYIIQIRSPESYYIDAEGLSIVIEVENSPCGGFNTLRSMNGSLKAFNSGIGKEHQNSQTVDKTYDIYDYLSIFPSGTHLCSDHPSWRVKIFEDISSGKIVEWEMLPNPIADCP